MEAGTLSITSQVVTLVLIICVLLLDTSEGTGCEFSHFLNGTPGNISTPNYPDFYPNSIDCTWKIETNPGEKIMLTFYDFKLGKSSGENFGDYVTLYDGFMGFSGRIRRYNGNELPPPTMSNTNRMFVVFHTDSADRNKGFKASYAKGCALPHIFNTTTGIISSPNYPEVYPNAAECIWKIEANPGDRIIFTFHDFQFERYIADHLGDYVALYDGSTINGTRLGRFTGKNIPPPTTSLTNRMLVVFHTDSFTVFRGFTASYAVETRISYFPGVEESKRRMTEFLLSAREQQARSINKWGAHVSRIAVSLYLNDKHIFDIGNTTGEEITLELSLQLLSKLAWKEKISTKDLALYINALTVTCFDPKDFFGVNLVKELRKRVSERNTVHPFSIFTLCNAGDTMTMDDVVYLLELYDAHVRPVWTDVQAMTVMALSCIDSRSKLSLEKRIINDMVSELKTKQHNNGTIEDWKTTALVVQALIAADYYQKDFDWKAAVKVMLEGVSSHMNIEDIYYVFPIFNDMSLANINSDHCGTLMKTEKKGYIYDHPAGLIQAQISVVTDDDMDFSRTWKLKVPSNCTFYQALETLGTLEPSYKAQYKVSEGKPYVVGLGNLLDDSEDGRFWFVYSKSLSTSGILHLIKSSPIDIQTNETHEMILWYRAGFISNSSGNSQE